MRGPIILTTIVVLLFAGSLAAQGLLRSPRDTTAAPRDCRRLVSVAPSVTETLFALGLGDRVVGVSRFCDYPAEAAARPKIGGYFDLSFEAVLALRPELVVMLVEHEANLPAFEKLGLPALVLNHKTVDGILASLSAIGAACDAREAAERLGAELTDRMQRVQQKTAGLSRPRVMFVIDRATEVGTIQDCYVAGAEGYFDRMIELSGGQNVCRESLVRYPVVSREGIICMNPEVIVDLSGGVADAGRGSDRLADWRQLASVEAVRRGRVHDIHADYAFRPGPRFILLVERLARLIHAEVDWSDPSPARRGQSHFSRQTRSLLAIQPTVPRKIGTVPRERLQERE